MNLSRNISTHNFNAFLWHAVFLAFAQNFMDVDTVMPAMVVEAGGKALHVGIMSAIMMGGASFTQLLFAPFVSNVRYKKKYLLFGINIRVFSLLSLAVVMYVLSQTSSTYILWFVFLFISLFSFSGAFTNISYVDVLGKSINQDKRKSFFSSRQILGGVIIIGTAFLAKKILAAYDFPQNYSAMFLIAGSVLLVASLGFWKVKEVEPSGTKISGIKGFVQNMSFEMKNNKKLIYFLGFINTQGVILSFIPFIILYAKEIFQTQGTDTGMFLLFKVAGVVGMSFIVLLFNKKIKYNVLLYSNIFLAVWIAVMTIFIKDQAMLKYIFILGGVAVSMYTITMNGVLLEISGIENRALYTGIAGAGNIVPAIFPLVSGWLISSFGYKTFFLMFILLISSSIFFVYKIKCKR